MSRLSEHLQIDLEVMPGVLSDFDYSADNAGLRIPGHAAGTFEWTDTMKIVLGVTYLDRNDIGALPLAGLIWTPTDDVKFDLVFPRPRLARRVYWQGLDDPGSENWLYIAGELGGGTWGIRRTGGNDDEMTYRDFRAFVGWETLSAPGDHLRLELGYVFGRKLEFTSNVGDDRLSDTVMCRASLGF